MSAAIIRSLWLLLMAWQLIWHGLAGGYGWGPAIVLFSTVVWLTPGVWRLHPRSLMWALFFSLPLMMVAAMEWVARPQDWPMSATQLILCLVFQASAIMMIRLRLKPEQNSSATD